MKHLSLLILALGLFVPALPANSARACGGFFCGLQPVDQSAERIVFRINSDDTVTMAVQVTYSGEAKDFAWILPLPEVPDPDKLATFPLAAMVALDAQTGPRFNQPCYEYGGWADASAGSFADAGTEGGSQQPTPPPPVIVHVEKEVGNYIAAVVESEDPEALHQWLRDNDYRVADAMKPYIKIYTDEGMKFLALKLQADSDVSDIVPFQLTLPGQTPMIPLRLTALAAEPEMSVAVFILGDRRFEAADWPNLAIDENKILWSDRFGRGLQTNYAALVAQAVDKNSGKGWVTEFAGDNTDYLRRLRNQKEDLESWGGDDETLANVNAMLSMMEGTDYITRLYTRLSPEEMSSDPRFKRSAGSDVSREIDLPESVDGKNLCPDWGEESDVSPCDLTTCGAGGICRNVTTDVGVVAACGCVPGATARSIIAEDGMPSTICQDQRMSFLNPGDRDESGMVLPDPCADYSCGSSGTCTTINMTPTCVCAEGYVAVSDFEGTIQCVEPNEDVPDAFYDLRLPPLALSPGRAVDVVRPNNRGCNVGGAPSWSAALLLGLLGLGLLRRKEA